MRSWVSTVGVKEREREEMLVGEVELIVVAEEATTVWTSESGYSTAGWRIWMTLCKSLILPINQVNPFDSPTPPSGGLPNHHRLVRVLVGMALMD